MFLKGEDNTCFLKRVALVRGSSWTAATSTNVHLNY